MTEVVKNSTQYLTDADLKAIAVYLKDVPASSNEPPGAGAHRRGHGARRGALHRQLHRLPHARRRRRRARSSRRSSAAPSIQAREPGTVLHVVLGRRDRWSQPRTKPPALTMPGVRREAERSADRRRRELHPQRLGQPRIAGRRQSRRRRAQGSGAVAARQPRQGAGGHADLPQQRRARGLRDGVSCAMSTSASPLPWLRRLAAARGRPPRRRSCCRTAIAVQRRGVGQEQFALPVTGPTATASIRATRSSLARARVISTTNCWPSRRRVIDAQAESWERWP